MVPNLHNNNDLIMNFFPSLRNNNLLIMSFFPFWLKLHNNRYFVVIQKGKWLKGKRKFFIKFSSFLGRYINLQSLVYYIRIYSTSLLAPLPLPQYNLIEYSYKIKFLLVQIYKQNIRLVYAPTISLNFNQILVKLQYEILFFIDIDIQIEYLVSKYTYTHLLQVWLLIKYLQILNTFFIGTRIQIEYSVSIPILSYHQLSLKSNQHNISINSIKYIFYQYKYINRIYVCGWYDFIQLQTWHQNLICHYVVQMRYQNFVVDKWKIVPKHKVVHIISSIIFIAIFNFISNKQVANIVISLSMVVQGFQSQYALWHYGMNYMIICWLDQKIRIFSLGYFQSNFFQRNVNRNFFEYIYSNTFILQMLYIYIYTCICQTYFSVTIFCSKMTKKEKYRSISQNFQ
eukprot:TRINITY_DN3028_c0_g1_i6.p1 TRINITY_DN3028_c0_g1~~TRINITY_DN3028_c0_g1_i6.p1  ORF type:complete len:399 (+),score=-39.13 TRINITY_DN3028_c0_g1_i6:129-1325(+)